MHARKVIADDGPKSYLTHSRLFVQTPGESATFLRRAEVSALPAIDDRRDRGLVAMLCPCPVLRSPEVRLSEAKASKDRCRQVATGPWLLVIHG